jgi:ATP-dependent DNA ligase
MKDITGFPAHEKFIDSARVDRPKFRELIYRKDREIPIQYDMVQMKMDGIWGCLIINNGRWAIYSRTGKKKSEGVISDSTIDSVLLGEYMYGSHWAHTRDIDGEFYIFDCLRFEGKNIESKELAERTLCSEWAWEQCKQELEWLDILETYETYQWPELWDHYVIGEAYEGLVFKDSTSEYQHRNAWARMKAVVEVEYVCHSFRMADEGTKYEGQVGGVIGTFYDKEVYVTCGGLTEAMRQDFTENPEVYIGQVFKAKGNTWYPSGSIRHPKFLHWRDDKDVEDCTYDQIPKSVRERAIQ